MKVKTKKKEKSLSQVKKDTWAIFSYMRRLENHLEFCKGEMIWVDTKDGQKEVPLGMCITCKKKKPAVGTVGCLQAGHFIPGRTNNILFDERQVNGQCYPCNVPLKGAPREYNKFMVEKYGQKEVDQMDIDSRKTKHYSIEDLIEVQNKCKIKIKELEEEIWSDC